MLLHQSVTDDQGGSNSKNYEMSHTIYATDMNGTSDFIYYWQDICDIAFLSN